MTKEHEQAINNLQRLRKAYIDRHTLSELKKKSVKDDIASYDIAIQAIKDLDTCREPYNKGYEDGVKATNKDARIYVDAALDEIRAEILEYKDDKIIHAEQNEMIDIIVEIIDKYRK